MKQLTRPGSRDANLDLIRTVAIILVVLTHSIEGVFVLKYTHVAKMSYFTGFLGFFFFTLGRIGVPLFLFLTGYLMLPREYDNTSLLAFYKRNLLPLVLVCQFWTLIYSIFMTIHYKSDFSIVRIIFRLLFISSGTLPHTWYIPKIIGLYIFIPFISIVLNRISFKRILVIGIIVFLAFFCFPWFKNFMEHYFLDYKLTLDLDLTFAGGIYGLYLVIGYLIARYREKIDQAYKKDYNQMLSACIVILSIAAATVLQMFFASKDHTYKVWYDFPLIPIIGFCLFTQLLQVKLKERTVKLVKSISVCSFGIYLLHEMIVVSATRLLLKWDSLYLKTLVILVSAFALSFVVVYPVGKIPKVKMIFLIKDRKTHVSAVSNEAGSSDSVSNNPNEAGCAEHESASGTTE